MKKNKSTDIPKDLLKVRYNYYLKHRYYPNIVYCAPKQLDLIDHLHIIYSGYYADLAICIDENLQDYDMVPWHLCRSEDIEKELNKTVEYRIRSINEK